MDLKGTWSIHPSWTKLACCCAGKMAGFRGGATKWITEGSAGKMAGFSEQAPAERRHDGARTSARTATARPLSDHPDPGLRRASTSARRWCLAGLYVPDCGTLRTAAHASSSGVEFLPAAEEFHHVDSHSSRTNRFRGKQARFRE